MPEELEIDTDKLRETVDEEIRRENSGFLRWISLTTAILAALAAIASLRAGATVNEALVLKTEATRLQAQASDQWAYYQAKGIKAAVNKGSSNVWQAAGKPIPGALLAEEAKYAAQQDTIRSSATKLEKDRDKRSAEADLLLGEHEWFAASVALFQIAIALGAIAALTRSRLTWMGSVLAGSGGIIVMVIPFLHIVS